MSPEGCHWIHGQRLLPLVTLCLLPAFVGAAEPAARRVTVFPDHYAADGKRFADLETLDRWVKSTGARSLEFHSCMWTSNQRLTAAIDRFQHVYIDVRWIDPGKSGCPAAVAEQAAAKP
jgi:hypothetical protein